MTPGPVPVVLLHGFSGSPESWDGVAGALPSSTKVFAPALLGHGSPLDGADEAVTGFQAEVDRIAELLRGREGDTRFHLVGYSLGARIALGLLVRHQPLFTSALLIGGQPGLQLEQERAGRRLADQHLCQILEELGIETFVRKWESIPLFASQKSLPEGVLASQRAARLCHDPRALARSLRSTGLGVMPSYWDALRSIRVPVRLVAGALDEKFTAIARRMAGSLPNAEVKIVPNVGHNVLLEAPDAVIQMILTRSRG
jgi:2-succinyl-6-hydroxy-2,4-cyclohexadiene-1-carboxylate synthase